MSTNLLGRILGFFFLLRRIVLLLVRLIGSIFFLFFQIFFSLPFTEDWVNSDSLQFESHPFAIENRIKEDSHFL